MSRLDLESVEKGKFRTNYAVTCLQKKSFLGEEQEWAKELVEWIHNGCKASNKLFTDLLEKAQVEFWPAKILLS